MPYGLHRYQQAETLHFITFSCFHRLPYLAAPAAKNLVQAILEQTRARHEARIYAYVLMPEHVHLLMNEPPRILVAQFLRLSNKPLPATSRVNKITSGGRATTTPYLNPCPIHRAFVSRDEWVPAIKVRSRMEAEKIVSEARTEVIQ